jgi:sulfonate transport system ATP-binding protein
LIEVVIKEKCYGSRCILKDISLSVAAGEIVSIVGASGCGKSTLLRIMAGLDPDFAGSVLLDQRRMDRHSTPVGFVFQEPRLLPWLSVSQNICFGPKRSMPSQRVAELLTIVGLDGRGADLPRDLSGGQAQRVAIARGLYSYPQALLLDEPFSAVDAFTRMRLADVLLSAVARYSTAIVLVTHDLDEAVYLGDRVILLDSTPGPFRLDVQIGLPRPRDRRAPALANARVAILSELYKSHAI